MAGEAAAVVEPVEGAGLLTGEAAAAPAEKPAGEPAAGEKPADKPAEAPIVYDFKLPEGAQADAETLDGFKALAGELKLPADKAQAVVDLGMKLLEKQTAAIQEQWAEQRKGWVDEIKSDPDFGGKQFDKTVEGAHRVLRQYGDKQTVEAIRELGLDSHPGLVKLLARVARATSEDSSIDRDVGAGGAVSQKSLAERMYQAG